MSTTYIIAELRRIVVARAEEACEYCLIHDDDTFFGCQVDHIVSEKHGGPTLAHNLAYACLFCNLHKGSDVATFIPGTQTLVRFFNPRTDFWHTHFALDTDGITLAPLTEIGEATARIFRFNDPDRLEERQALQHIGRYPSPSAITRIQGGAYI
jgi:hypothetical protein